MRHSIKSLLSIGVFTAALAAPQAHAQSHSLAHPNAINPYVCDVVGADDFSSTLVNDRGHLTLRVKSSTNDNSSYFCTNAGGFAKMTHKFPLDTISAWVKLTGDFLPTDVFVEIYANDDPTINYFDATTAKQGPTVNGYTLYTWKAKDLGFPSNSTTSFFGFSINVYDVGSGFITGPALDGHAIPFAAHTILTCPFSISSQCAPG
ncbi:MAG TPA: hypothetical protein V6C81_22275 [Planktothrix sp.]